MPTTPQPWQGTPLPINIASGESYDGGFPFAWTLRNWSYNRTGAVDPSEGAVILQLFTVAGAGNGAQGAVDIISPGERASNRLKGIYVPLPPNEISFSISNFFDVDIACFIVYVASP